MYHIGIDAGGSSTRALLARGPHLLAEGRAGAANPRQVGIEEAHRQFERAICEAFVRAHLQPDLGHCTVFAGVAGLATDTDVWSFLEHPHPYARLEATSDALLTLEGYFSGSSGALLIVGTGCIALARGADGAIRRRMGWGFPLEQGSGAELGLESVRLGLLDWENGSLSLHRSALEERFSSPREVMEWARGAGASEFARFAPALLEGARRHKPRALERVGRWTALCRGLLESLRHEAGVDQVGVWGGLAESLLEFVQFEGYVAPRRTPLETALERARTLPR